MWKPEKQFCVKDPGLSAPDPASQQISTLANARVKELKLKKLNNWPTVPDLLSGRIKIKM